MRVNPRGRLLRGRFLHGRRPDLEPPLHPGERAPMSTALTPMRPRRMRPSGTSMAGSDCPPCATNGLGFSGHLTKHARDGMEFTQILDASFHLTAASQHRADPALPPRIIATHSSSPFPGSIPSARSSSALDGGWIAPDQNSRPVGEKYTRLGIIHSLDGKTWRPRSPPPCRPLPRWTERSCPHRRRRPG